MARSNTLLVLTVIMISWHAVSGQIHYGRDVELPGGFTKPLADLILKKEQMITEMKAIKANVDQADGLTKFISTLNDLKSLVQVFINSPLDVPDTNVKELELALAFHENPSSTNDLLQSFTLMENNNRRAHQLFSKLKIDVKKEITEMANSELPNLFNLFQNKRFTIEIPGTIVDLSTMCHDVGSKSYSLVLDDLREISITRLCQDIKSCPQGSTLYSHKQQQGEEQDVSAVCTADNQCNMQEALPMMTGILWYQINEVIFQRLCPRNCQGECNYRVTYAKVLEDIERLVLYAASLPNYWDATWHSFFQQVLDNHAFFEIDVAMTLAQEKISDLEISNKQCNTIKFEKACSNADLYQQYSLVQKTLKTRINGAKVKDLRPFSELNLAQRLQQGQADVNKLEILRSIEALDENLNAVAKGVSEYFVGITKFDEEIAVADVAYIEGQLRHFQNSLQLIESQLNTDIKEAMTYMEVILVSNLADKVVKLTAALLTNSNPLKLFFSGPDTTDMIDIANEIANAGADLAKGIAIITTIDDLFTDSMDLRSAFGINTNQLHTLQFIVEMIQKGTSDVSNIEKHRAKFVKEYGAYTPAVDRSKLVKNDALWSAYKGAICDVLSMDVGVLAAIPKGIAGAKLLCEKLEGTLAQFFTLREDMYDFQFQLVDAVAAIVRGNIAQRFAANIHGKHDVLKASELMTGLFLVQSKTQQICSVYCDRLEYKNLGRPVSVCSTATGLFKKENIGNLIAYADNTPYDVVEKDVFIPTRARAPMQGPTSDSGMVDLQALGRGQTVVFKIPVDQTWLEEYGWILPGRTTIPFVKSLKLYLPRKKAKAKNLITTEITLTSIARSLISTVNPNTGVAYILPKTSYRTLYEEGFAKPQCTRTNLMPNPYSLCNNLPKICDKLKSQGTTLSNPLLPTILSTWSLNVKVSQGLEMINYDAPSPDTNLLLKAKVSFLIMNENGSKKKSHLPSLVPRSDVQRVRRNECCRGNRYKTPRDDRKCFLCPQGTSKSHGGLFCQINAANQ